MSLMPRTEVPRGIVTITVSVEVSGPDVKTYDAYHAPHITRTETIERIVHMAILPKEFTLARQG
jgi:hypothetical protein